MWNRLLIVFALSAASALAQTDPGWWSNVIRSGDSHALANNYAPANLGQLKNFADQARLHLNATLPGGSGTAIETMVAGWPASTGGNYVPINLGQLKVVADKFYSRLDEVGFDYKSQLIANGYQGIWTTTSGGKPRPWNESASPATNYAPANLGQLKIVFSFDLTGFIPDGVPGDVDGDGFLDANEAAAGLVVGIKDNPALQLQVTVTVN